MGKFGLIGKGIQYSKSKELFDSYFHGTHTYDIIDTSNITKDLLLSYSGLNVTTPYKIEVIKYLDYIDPLADRIGSVNCINNDCGFLCGYNTDYYGFKRSLKGYDIKNMLVLGNGGVTNMIKQYAKDYGIVLVVCGRHGEYDINYSDLSDYSFDCIVNATKFGVLPDIGYSKIEKDTLVFDLCYGESTIFINECKKYGHDKCIDGSLMLYEQAMKSYFIWSRENFNSTTKASRNVSEKVLYLT